MKFPLHAGCHLLNTFFLITSIYGPAFCFSPPDQTYSTLEIPLNYEYLPGEPFWSRFGSIDSRIFSLWIGKNKSLEPGIITGESNEKYQLRLQGDLDAYIGKSFTTVLTHYGIKFQSNGPAVLRVFPVAIRFQGYSNNPDGAKVCTIRLQVQLSTKDGSLLFNASVDNSGSDQFDADDEGDYSDLLDRTMHGALFKLWASQILFTEKPLGNISIVKKEPGVYGYCATSDTTISTMRNKTIDPARIYEAYGNVPDSANTHTYSINTNVPETAYEYTKNPDAPPSAKSQKTTANSTTPDPAPPLILTGNFKAEDSIVIDPSNKISLGILPVENNTGNDKLTLVSREVHAIFQELLSHARTVKVLDRDKLADILKEQALGLSGIINDSTAVHVGNIVGVQVMVALTLTTAGSYYRLTARIINVETSAIVAGASIKIPDGTKIPSQVPELAAKILFEFTEEKLVINRNTMGYPPPAPLAMSALCAGVEDAWAVEYNPAALMKIKDRDAHFFMSIGTKLRGHLNSPAGPEFTTTQPPYERMGIHVALPIGSYLASGFGIQYRYCHPKVAAEIASALYEIKAEETIFTIPLGVGLTPRFSFGLNIRHHIMEYSIVNPGFPYASGNAQYTEGMLACLFKVSDRFRTGLTIQLPSFYMYAKEKTGSNADFQTVTKKTPYSFRIGTAMYPLRWLFFFADLLYEKQPDNEKMQPGFFLGAELHYTGRPFFIRWMPQYGMIPLYIGYSHEPFNKGTGTQAKFISFGTGYFLKNVYGTLSCRFSVLTKENRNMVVGNPPHHALTIYDYQFTTPVFLCVGYRF